MSDKLPLILFSGGLDSTYLLYDTLKTTDCDILYVAGAQGSNKIKAELAAIEKLRAVFKQLLCGDDVKYRIRKFYQISIGPDGREGRQYGFSQPGQWIYGAYCCIDPALHSKLLVAYVQGDQINARVPFIQAAWDNLYQGCVNPTGEYQQIPLETPLVVSVTKQQILSVLPWELLEHVWVCELPETTEHENEFRPCGRCMACQRHYVERFVYRFHDRDIQAVVNSDRPPIVLPGDATVEDFLARAHERNLAINKAPVVTELGLQDLSNVIEVVPGRSEPGNVIGFPSCALPGVSGEYPPSGPVVIHHLET